MYYPEIPAGAVFAMDIILRSIEEQGASYLDGSPYDAETLEFLSRFVREESTEELVLGDKWERLEAESNKLFKDLTDAGDQLTSDDAAEMMSYFRTKTNLLEKIVSIQERAANLKKLHQFYGAVLTVMEDLMDADQRGIMLERLNAL